MKVKLLSLFMCVSSFALGQSKNINGTYLSKFGEKIEITNNELVYIIPQEHLPTWDNDTLARCTFVWVDGDCCTYNWSELLHISLTISIFVLYLKAF